MTYTPPPPQTSAINITHVQQNDEALLLRNDIQTVIKDTILKYYLEKDIRKNNAEQIISSLTVQDLQTHRYIMQHNESTEHFAASVNKLPVTMLTLEELRSGAYTMDTILTWQASDRRAGAGVFDQSNSPLQAPLKDVLFDMLNHSSNTSVRVLVNKVLGGNQAVNARFASVPQIPHTRLIYVDDDRFYLGNTTSKEALWVLAKVLSQQDTYGAFVKNALATNIFTSYGVQAVPRSDFIVLANKMGQLNDPDGNNRHDVGVIYNTRTHKSYGYSLLTTSPNASVTATVRAEASLQSMGGLILRYAGNKATSTAPSQAAPQTLRSNTNNAIDTKILY
jgi:beta-lactamase class A